MWRLYVLFDFIRISDPEKRMFEFFLPVVVTFALGIPLLLMPSPPTIFGGDGIINLSVNALAILVGFFVAALAAVATFPKESLDEPLKGERVVLRSRNPTANDYDEQLSRRRFLCLLFGYLATISLILIVFFVISYAFRPYLEAAFAFSAYAWRAYVSFNILYVLHIVFVTFFGLFYLVDRIHRDPPEIKGGPKRKGRMPPDLSL